MDPSQSSIIQPTVDIAGRAASLSSNLYTLGETCAHQSTSRDISSIAGELALLSTAAWRLNEAFSANEDDYTPAFRNDLDEINTELSFMLDEVEECCTGMHKADSCTSSVAWFFKKGRVSKLHRHLEALKSTLIVMRTVLHHGKVYGLQNSPSRLAESDPHTMFEDRAILDSIFAKNRNAIMDLHNLERQRHSSSSSSAPGDKGKQPADHRMSSSTGQTQISPGAHGRNLSSATGVGIPPGPDVLPALQTETIQTDNGATASNISRRFSKRGVRLGVHMSILDMGAHDVAAGLRKKWITQASANMPRIDEKEHEGGTSPAVNGTGTGSRSRSNSRTLVSSPIGKALGKVIHRLSISRPGARHDHDQGFPEPTVSATDENEPIKKLSIRVTERLVKPELKTPDFNKEFENGARL